MTMKLICLLNWRITKCHVKKITIYILRWLFIMTKTTSNFTRSAFNLTMFDFVCSVGLWSHTVKITLNSVAYIQALLDRRAIRHGSCLRFPNWYFIITWTEFFIKHSKKADAIESLNLLKSNSTFWKHFGINVGLFWRHVGYKVLNMYSCSSVSHFTPPLSDEERCVSDD